MSDHRVALYARVSTEQQARDHTILSQVASLRERIAADGWQLEPDDAYVDEGYSGSFLVRPALERRAMLWHRARSGASTSWHRIGWPAVMRIRCF
ncbi:putative site-specific integrase-resolvase [Skermanella aerolata]|uniref:recombinase family protein n=1 Tax=Skermanella aerolata TaxID=393310 RepID=UPI003D2569DC